MSKTFSECIEFLVRAKFPNASTPDSIVARKRLGLKVSNAEAKQTYKAEAYRAKLRKIKPERLERLCAEEGERQRFQQEALRADWTAAKARGHEGSAKQIDEPRSKRSRSDFLATEIEQAISELGSSENRKAIMEKLKSYAGREGSCILRTVPEGLKWRDSNRHEKTLDTENLRKRLDRRAERGRR